MNRVPKLDYRVVIEFLSSLNCPRALTVAIMLRYEHYKDIVSLSFNPFDYNDLEDARCSLAATELLRKHSDLPTSIDKSAVAYESFFAAEEACKVTNDRLRNRNDFAGLLFVASRKISNVLGDFAPDELIEFAGWGPGSTVAIKRREASATNKFRQDAELTPALYRLLKPWFRSQFPHWDTNFREYEGNKVITVPKNAKTDRIIAVEPSLNLYFQKGIGTMIRRRLHRFGVDLNTQLVNQELCALGSRTGSLATVDFSAASDTISYQLVLDLLPFNWFQVLDVLRSPRGYVNKELIEYEKFSSMGNGFTFELESLVFWALAKACVPETHPNYKDIVVFGDDVIIPSDYVPLFDELCTFCGFTINRSKSFDSSYYRESCGVHYWNGVNITPIYNRHYLVKDEVMRFHNRVGELSRRFIGCGFRDTRFRACMKILSDACKAYSPRVPEGYGDIGLVTSFDEVCPVYDRAYQRGFRCRAIISLSARVYEDDDSVRLAALYHLMKRDGVDRMSDHIPEGNRISYSSRGRRIVKTIWLPDWPCLGSWI